MLECGGMFCSRGEAEGTQTKIWGVGGKLKKRIKGAKEGVKQGLHTTSVLKKRKGTIILQGKGLPLFM